MINGGACIRGQRKRIYTIVLRYLCRTCVNTICFDKVVAVWWRVRPIRTGRHQNCGFTSYLYTVLILPPTSSWLVPQSFLKFDKQQYLQTRQHASHVTYRPIILLWHPKVMNRINGNSWFWYSSIPIIDHHCPCVTAIDQLWTSVLNTDKPFLSGAYLPITCPTRNG